MQPLAEDELDALKLDALVTRMDTILHAPHSTPLGHDPMATRVSDLMQTSRVKGFGVSFQRKVAYKTFGMLLQLTYTHFPAFAQFAPLPKDAPETRQLHGAAREQWAVVSSRIVFEYFMHLTYMLGTGEAFEPRKSTLKGYRTWLKEPGNQYTYFAISAARACQFDRRFRTPEVHAATKLARRVLLLSATDYSLANEASAITSTLLNQWQYLLQIADGQTPKGWGSVHMGPADGNWYDLWASGDRDAINAEIDRMFKDADSGALDETP